MTPWLSLGWGEKPRSLCERSKHQLGSEVQAEGLTPSSESDGQGKDVFCFVTLFLCLSAGGLLRLVLVYFNIHLCSTASS